MAATETNTIEGQLPGKPCPRNPRLRRIKTGEPIPDGWFPVSQNTFYTYIERPNELAGLKGGPKQMWLRQHSEEVIDYYYKYGEDATINRFILTERTSETLLRIRGFYKNKPVVFHLTPLDKLETRLGISEENVRELRGEVAELKRAFALFQQGVANQITKKLLIPLLQQGIEPNPELEAWAGPNPLSLEGFPLPGGNSEKAAAGH